MFLDRIVATKKEEVETLKLRLTIREAEKAIISMPACRNFIQALTDRRKRGMGLIAEVKKASPSKGLIRGHFEPALLAQSYERAGADCISILTDETYFQGSNAYLQQIRQQVSVPLLRKDFVIDELQIYEARMIGADAVLLIAAILTTDEMRRFMDLSHSLGLSVLLEVHDRAELERVLELDAKLIGINNRNLKTFVTDLIITEELVPFIPKGVTIVSESGISSAEELAYVRSAGADAVLIGEHFMRKPSVEDAVYELFGLTERV